MTPQERLRAAVIIIRDAIEKQDYEQALREHQARRGAVIAEGDAFDSGGEDRSGAVDARLPFSGGDAGLVGHAADATRSASTRELLAG